MPTLVFNKKNSLKQLQNENDIEKVTALTKTDQLFAFQ
jgi:hypothetical protein